MIPRAVVVAGVACGAALLGSMSGGSTSLLTTPAWVALGTPFPTAVAVDKVAATVWTLAASRTYLRRSGVDGPLLRRLLASGLAGAAVGAMVVTSLDERLLRRGAGLLLLAVLALSMRGRPPASARLPEWLASAAGVPLGMYEGVLGSGNAIFTTAVLQRMRGWDLPAALGHYYVLAAGWCGLAAAVYLARGAMDWDLALPATAGALAGALAGSRLGMRFGALVIRPLFLGAGVVLALHLLVSP